MSYQVHTVTNVEELRAALAFADPILETDLNDPYIGKSSTEELFSLIEHSRCVVYYVKDGERMIAANMARMLDEEGRKDRQIAGRAPAILIDFGAVDPAHRRRGLSTILLRECYAWAIAHGIAELVTEVLCSNDPSLEHMRREGFVISHRMSPSLGNKENFFILRKSL